MQNVLILRSAFECLKSLRDIRRNALLPIVTAGLGNLRQVFSRILDIFILLLVLTNAR